MLVHPDRLKIAPLGKEIQPTESKFHVKGNSVTITLVKKANEHWDDIKERSSPFKAPQKGMDKDEDPQASLLKMMKDMYDSGDEDMKRMIAQSWTKAQDEQHKKHA